MGWLRSFLPLAFHSALIYTEHLLWAQTSCAMLEDTVVRYTKQSIPRPCPQGPAYPGRYVVNTR